MIGFDLANYEKRLLRVSYGPVEDPLNVLERLNKKRVFAYADSTDLTRFPLSIRTTLQKISEIKIGQELLNYLARNQDGPPLRLSLNEKFLFFLDKKEIHLQENSFQLWSNNEKDNYSHLSFEASFVHELLHFRHSLENKGDYLMRQSFKDRFRLLNPNFHDGEEQLTICGIDCLRPDAKLSICENHFHRAWGEPLRFTHRAWQDPKQVIENDIPVNSTYFSSLFKCYLERFSPTSYQKKTLIVNIPNPTANQTALVNEVERFIRVHNVSTPSPEPINISDSETLSD